MSRGASAAPARARRSPSGAQARKPRAPLGRRLGRYLPRPARTAALALAAVQLAGLVYLLNGPLLRVEQVEASGARYTPQRTLAGLLQRLEGRQLLGLDSRSVAEELRRLPAIEAVRVSATLPGRVRVTVVEKRPVIVWQTQAAWLAAAADGTLVARVDRAESPPPELVGLPLVDDARPSSAALTAGDRLDARLVSLGLRLARLDPRTLGSAAPSLAVKVDPLYGFMLVSGDPSWQAALGFYDLELTDGDAAAQQRLDRQVAAVRTLFAGQPEATVYWLDARNPGKVYFRASDA